MSGSRIFLVFMLLASVALGGCGRRGPLELPPSAAPQAAEDTTKLADRQAAAFNETPAAQPGVLQSPNQVVQVKTSAAQLAAQPPGHPINAPPVAKPITFALDPLL